MKPMYMGTFSVSYKANKGDMSVCSLSTLGEHVMVHVENWDIHLFS